MPISSIPIIRRLVVPYTPLSDERPFLQRIQVQAKNDVEFLGWYLQGR